MCYNNWMSKDSARRMRLKAEAIGRLGGKCVSCGIEDERVLEFDHVNPSEKKYAISDLWRGSERHLWIEVAKCQLLCANCHRIKTVESKDSQRRRTPDPLSLPTLGEDYFIKVCPHCKGRFSTISPDRVYCCRECIKQSASKRWRQKIRRVGIRPYTLRLKQSRHKCHNPNFLDFEVGPT